jgi:hypothetical protein
MNKEKYVFAQLVEFLNNDKFRRIVAKYHGDRYVKHFTCWNQLLALMFGQLCNRESLRDLICALDAHHDKCYHLGIGRNVSKTNLAYANQVRDCRIFEEFAYYVVEEARNKRATILFNLEGHVYAFDSTTIDLCLAVFWWAAFRKHKGGVKVHTLFDVETQIPAFFLVTAASVHDVNAMDVIPYETGAYYIFDRAYDDYKRLFHIHQIGAFFVIRAKDNIRYKITKWKRRMPKNVLTDARILLTGYLSSKRYPEELRMVRYWDEEQGREFVFLTNAMNLSALEIANLYRNRWQVELFFKWLKQHLKIKKFWGTTENAVKIQIYAAMTAYCLVAIVQHDLKLDISTYEMLQKLSVTLTEKTPLRELFAKPKISDVKDQFDPNGQLLLNF